MDSKLGASVLVVVGGLERVHDLLMGVRARLRAVCVVANPRNSQAIAVVCASQPIPNRIPHTFIRDHEHVLRKTTLKESAAWAA
jgi:hypothetical protein